MNPTLREARDTLVPDLAGRHGPLPPLLLALTVVTGLVDAFSYLALGRVFVANMTGNVVFMAFSLAGSSGFSLTASVLSLLSFAVGALAAGRFANRVPLHRARLLLGVTAAQALLVLVCYAVGLVVDLPASGWSRWSLVVVLGLAMGGQNAVVRKLAVPDLTTTVLTLTITGVAADSRLASGATGRAGRRLLSAAAMFLGALLGAALVGHGHPAVVLLVAGAALVAVAGALLPHRRSALGWTAA
ncbi:YoaK family protein [Actinacidiphila alni]|uniref:YoaK family protein n=1 Tax=Actinacidiphila alni TaxID=380248 RepID=UPI0033EAF157